MPAAPTTWTDPSGHTASNAAAQVPTIETIVVEVGSVLLAFLPVLLAGGPIAAAVGLYFFVLFLALVALSLTVIADVLELLTTAFDHYADDPPTERQSDRPILRASSPRRPIPCSRMRLVREATTVKLWPFMLSVVSKTLVIETLQAEESRRRVFVAVAVSKPVSESTSHIPTCNTSSDTSSRETSPSARMAWPTAGRIRSGEDET